MGDLEALVAALRDIESGSAVADPAVADPALPVVAALPAVAREHATVIGGSRIASAIGEIALTAVATACGAASLAFAWLLLRP